MTERFSTVSPQVIPQQLPISSPAKPHKKEKKERKKKRIIPSKEGMKLSELLLKNILSFHANFHKPNLNTWAKEMDKALQTDKRSAYVVEEVICWLPSSPFWRKNILSPRKLRKHFDRLLIEKQGTAQAAPSYQEDHRQLPEDRRKSYANHKKENIP